MHGCKNLNTTKVTVQRTETTNNSGKYSNPNAPETLFSTDAKCSSSLLVGISECNKTLNDIIYCSVCFLQLVQ